MLWLVILLHLLLVTGVMTVAVYRRIALERKSKSLDIIQGELVHEENSEEDTSAKELTELLPYLEDSEIEKYYLESNPDVKRQSLALWNLRKQATQYSGLLHLDSDTMGEIRQQACRDLSAMIQRESSYTESVANEYKRLSKLVPTLTENTVSDFNEALGNLKTKREQLVESQAEVAFELMKQENALQEKFYALYKEYPFPFKHWDWAQKMAEKFNNSEPLTGKDIVALHAQLDMKNACFIAAKGLDDKVHVRKIRLRVNRKTEYSVNVTQGKWLFFFPDGSINDWVEVGGKKFTIRNNPSCHEIKIKPSE